MVFCADTFDPVRALRYCYQNSLWSYDFQCFWSRRIRPGSWSVFLEFSDFAMGILSGATISSVFGAGAFDQVRALTGADAFDQAPALRFC